MATKRVIEITNPSVALITCIEKMRQRKKDRMKEMRDKFLNKKGA